MLKINGNFGILSNECSITKKRVRTRDFSVLFFFFFCEWSGAPSNLPQLLNYFMPTIIFGPQLFWSLYYILTNYHLIGVSKNSRGRHSQYFAYFYKYNVLTGNARIRILPSFFGPGRLFMMIVLCIISPLLYTCFTISL